MKDDDDPDIDMTEAMIVALFVALPLLIVIFLLRTQFGTDN